MQMMSLYRRLENEEFILNERNSLVKLEHESVSVFQFLNHSRLSCTYDETVLCMRNESMDMRGINGHMRNEECDVRCLFSCLSDDEKGVLS